jgi:ABC-type cobalamin/Fe3+-siderophores transport system ATPase subunit
MVISDDPTRPWSAVISDMTAALTGMENTTVQVIEEGRWTLRKVLNGGRGHRLFAELWEGRERRLVRASAVEQRNPALLLYAPVIVFDSAHLASAMETIATHPELRVCRWLHPVRKMPYLALAASLYLFDLSVEEITDSAHLLAQCSDGLEVTLSDSDAE